MNGLTVMLRKSVSVVAVGCVLVAAPIVYAGLAPVRPSVGSADATVSPPGKDDAAPVAEGIGPSPGTPEVAVPAAGVVTMKPSDGNAAVPVVQATPEPVGKSGSAPPPLQVEPAYRRTDQSGREAIPTGFATQVLPSSPPTAEPQSQGTPPTIAQSPSTLPQPSSPTLAFVSRRSGSDQVYTANADGSGLTQLTFGRPTVAPIWLGATGGLAYVRTTGELPQGDLVTRSADGRERVIVSGGASRPSSSPDGTRLTYESTETSPESQLFTINVDGTGKRQLTNSSCFNAQPAWSPDGTRIAFWSSRDSCASYDLYVMNADGSAPTRLTSGAPAFSSGGPSWSPDGHKLAFETTRDGNSEIYTMNADGSGLARITNNPGSDAHPTWSGDGTRIAFQSSRSGNVDIYSTNTDGSDLRRITVDPADDTAPSWRPAAR